VTGKLNYDFFRKSYNFLDEYQDNEIGTLQVVSMSTP
jgi:hypothetical protein